jgi:cell wall-associated NlpC family hydrolase
MTTHPSPLHPARHRINVLCARGIVAAGLGMATLGGLLGAVPAVASPQLTSAQDRATQLRHTVDDLRVRTEQAAESYDAAAAGLAAAVTEHGLADRQLTQAHADAAAGRNTMAARVRSLYVSGGPTALYASVLASHDLSDVFSRFRSVRAVAEGDQAVVDRADAALTHSGQVESSLADAADRQNRLECAAAAAAAQVGQLLEQEAGVLAGADADVVRIAEADRKAEQEAAERAFQAQLAAAQATAAQAVQAARLAAQAAATADIGSGSQPGVGVAPAATEVGRAALAEAVRQIGKPYVWGAVGADSFDCSGLTQWAYARAGVGLPRVAAEQWYAGAHISLGDLAAGDLLFWATDPANPATIHHVAIYAGNGQMVAAPHSGALVQLQPVYLAGYIGAVRPSAGP